MLAERHIGRLLVAAAALVIVITVAMGLRASKFITGIDLNTAHLTAFEAGRQMFDFDRLGNAAKYIALTKSKADSEDLEHAFAMSRSRISNFQNGDVGRTTDEIAKKHIARTIDVFERMEAVMVDESCDTHCKGLKLVRLTSRAKREMMKLQGHALAVDGRMRNALQDSYEETVKKIFALSGLLVAILGLLTFYIFRKNAVLQRQAETLETSQRRILEVSEYRARFLAGMSHEFRTPLNAIKGFCQMMQYFGAACTEAKKKEYLEAIEKSAIDLETLTNTILDLAKVDAGAFELDESDIDLPELLHEVESQFVHGYELPAGRLKLEASNELWVYGDPTAIKRCVQNIVSNALKFSPPGTTVTVRLWRENRKTFISVRDHGCGIPVGEIDAVWDVYVRSSYTRTSDKQGTGLGLPIVRTLVKAHGGDIELESAPGEGATVTIALPAFRSVESIRSLAA